MKLHEEAYGNNLTKVKHASGKLGDVRNKIQKYDADLKMSRAEAEMAKLAGEFDFDVTTDFGQIEQVINDKISLNRAKVRVAADMSSDGIADIKHEQAMEKVLGDQALKDFEVQMGLVTPETAREGGHQGTRSGGKAGKGLEKAQAEGSNLPCGRSGIAALQLYYGPHCFQDVARCPARLVAGLGAGNGGPVLFRHDLPLRAARKRPRLDRMRRRPSKRIAICRSSSPRRSSAAGT